MFNIVPKAETRFWRIFRCLLFPVALFAFLLLLIAAIGAVFGGQSVIFDDREYTGWMGAFLCFLSFPFFTLAFTITATCVLYFERRARSFFRRSK